MQPRIHPFSYATRRMLAALFVVMAPACARRHAPETEADSVESPYRILLVGDPFALAMERARPVLENQVEGKILFETVGYNDGRRLALLNARDRVSQFDLVAYDIVWLGEFVQNRVLLDLTPSFAPHADRFLSAPLEGCRVGNHLYGLPIQPHAELLWIRSDLFAEHNLSPPRTTDELLAAARQLHNPTAGMYGLAWNAQRGQPLGQSMAHFFAAFGQPLLDDRGLPAFDTERGLQAARFALNLMDVSPPDILNMAWDQRTSRFASGQVAMTYGWAARARATEFGAASQVTGKVHYLPAPHAPGVEPVTPLGVWALGVPANVRSPERSIRLLQRIMDEEAQRKIHAQGNTTPPLVSLFQDPEVQAHLPAFRTLGEINQRGELRMEMRPRIPQWDALCGILGHEFHDMLSGRTSPEEALRRAQASADDLFSQSPAVLTP